MGKIGREVEEGGRETDEGHRQTPTQASRQTQTQISSALHEINAIRDG